MGFKPKGLCCPQQVFDMPTFFATHDVENHK
jgi:hypothetical protein